MMEAHGYKEGQGLGKSGTGIVEPVAAGLQQSRAGLGFGAASDAPATFDLLPDTNWLPWDPDMPTAFATDVMTLMFVWESVRVDGALPEDVRNTKVMRSEVFLAVKLARRRAQAALKERAARDPTRRALCPHHGAPCLQPCSIRNSLASCRAQLVAV
jgi:G-patch domain